jgi:nicotinamide-nucleotide amidase
MSTSSPRTAALLAIGDEVLRGEIVNSNAAFLADHLFELGFVLREHRVVSDDPQDIRHALETLAAASDVLLCTGGLGPTDDDRTLDVVCALLGTEPATHEPSLLTMKQAYAARGFELTPNNLRQVRVPLSGRALPNPVGTAPGFSVRIGQTEAFFFPGVPREMQRIFLDHVAPELRAAQLPSGWPLPAVRTFHVLGMGESHVDHRLTGLIALAGVEAAHVSVHYRTAAPENHVKVIVRGPDAAANAHTLHRLEQEVRARLGSVVYGVDDQNLPQVLARTFLTAGATLAFAESCTGGYAGQLVTAEPGASAFFLGGVVAYSDEVKRNLLGVSAETLAAHGAVSEPCALEMAQGARQRLGATVAVAITGIAGSVKDAHMVVKPEVSPAAGNSAKPVGTVCFGVSGPRGDRTLTQIFPSGRERIRRWSAHIALDLARRHFEDGNNAG